MLNCKQVSQLVSDSIDKKLPLWTRMNLSMHLAMCGLCKRFYKTIKRVHNEAKAYSDAVESGQADQEVVLSEAAKQIIRDRIDSEIS